MKKKGACCDYIMQRNENLRRELCRSLRGSGTTIEQAYRRLSKGGRADRFYISEERACRYLTTSEEPHVKSRKRMIEEIRRRVNRIMEENPEMDMKEAVYEVVNSPAPEFYLTPGSIRVILNRSL